MSSHKYMYVHPGSKLPGSSYFTIVDCVLFDNGQTTLYLHYILDFSRDQNKLPGLIDQILLGYHGREYVLLTLNSFSIVVNVDLKCFFFHYGSILASRDWLHSCSHIMCKDIRDNRDVRVHGYGIYLSGIYIQQIMTFQKTCSKTISLCRYVYLLRPYDINSNAHTNYNEICTSNYENMLHRQNTQLPCVLSITTHQPSQRCS